MKLGDDFRNPYQYPPGGPGMNQGFPGSQFAKPKPAVMTWQLVYVILMVLIYLAVLGIGVVLVQNRAEIAADDPETTEEQLMVFGTIYSVLGGVLALVYSVGLFWRNGKGGWVYNIVLQALGLTSCCTWPMTIPLLIFWIKHRDEIVSS